MPITIESERLILKRLTSQDVNLKYLDWMNDKELTEFMESRWRTYTIQDLIAYVEEINSNDENFLFGIYQKDANSYIGNIKVGPINKIHLHSDLGFIIGDKKFVGKGYATEAISTILKFCFNDLGLNKITSGYYSENNASGRCLEKNGFKISGTFKKDRLYNGKFIDCIKTEILKENWKEAI